MQNYHHQALHGPLRSSVSPVESYYGLNEKLALKYCDDQGSAGWCRNFKEDRNRISIIYLSTA